MELQKHREKTSWKPGLSEGHPSKAPPHLYLRSHPCPQVSSGLGPNWKLHGTGRFTQPWTPLNVAIFHVLMWVDFPSEILVGTRWAQQQGITGVINY